MGWLNNSRSRFEALVQKRRMDEEMAEEIRYHVESLTERNIAAGMALDAAHYAALRQFGHVEGIKEACRDHRGLPWLESLLRDFRFGVRLLRKSPGVTAATVLTLALAVGASTTIFSIVNQVVLRSLPYPDPGQLFTVYERQPPKYPQMPVSPRLFLEWRKQGTLLQESAVMARWPVVVTGAGEVSRCAGLKVSAGYFKLLGVPPLLGRTFQADDGMAGRDDVVVLNYKFWVRQFNGQREAIGRTIQINDRPCRIVGVMPETFLPDEGTDPMVFLPLVLEADGGPGTRARFLDAVARLKPGVTPAEAAGELNLIARHLPAQNSDASKSAGISLVPLHDTVVGNVRPLLFTLLGAVGILLLIACANVTNLLLARASSRQKEIAMRSALGASRSRLVRQLLCESLLISFLSGAAALLLACANMKLLLSFGPLPLPRAQAIALDGPAVLFACALALLTGLAFGVIPALQVTRVSLSEVMNDGGRGPGEGRRRTRLRRALVVFEVALALVLLIDAGLFIRSYDRLRRVPVGFDPGAGVTLVAKPALFEPHYPASPQILSFIDHVTARLSAVPGVQSVAFSTSLPFSYMNWRAVTIAGRSRFKPMEMAIASYYVVTPGYFKAMRIPLVDGRAFDARDTADSPGVVAVSEGFARRYFSGVNPLGQFIQVAGSNAWSEIVGVVTDVREHGPAEPAGLQVYLPYAQSPSRYPLLIIRLGQPSPGIRANLRAAMDTIDPNVPLPDLADTLDLPLLDSISTQRWTLVIFAVFSSVALALSAIGIYGVVAYSVTQRTQEIGIRMALGAQARDIMRLIFAQGRRMAGLGLGLGLLGALASTRLLGSRLFEVDALDPVTFAGATLLLGAVVLLACWQPARRATKVDPIIALHED